MGCQQTEASNQVLEAMNWYFGDRECRSVTFADDSSGDQAGQYFDINTINEDYEEEKYLFWLDDGVAAAPSPAADQTLVAVTYTQDDDAATIAALFKTAVESNTDAQVEVIAGAAEVLNSFLGPVTTEDQANAALLTFESHASGFGGSIGPLAEGGAELSSEQNFTDITSDSTGTLILDKIFTGGNSSITLSLNEMTDQRWQDLIGDTFGSNVDVSGSTLTGFGDDKLYRSAFTFAGQLVGHPIRLPNSDRSADLCMPKTVPQLGSLNYSGTDVQSAEFTFSALRDTSKPAGIRLFFRGDHSLV